MGGSMSSLSIHQHLGVASGEILLAFERARLVGIRPGNFPRKMSGLSETSIYEPSSDRLEMHVIKVCPVVWFRGAWKTSQGTWIGPIFPWPNGKQKAIDYARGLFGDTKGEIQVYDEDGATVIETIQIDSESSKGKQSHFSAPPTSTQRLAANERVAV